MAKVHLSGYLEVPADQLETVKAALPQHIALTLAEPGCLAFTVVQQPATPHRFDVAETFADQAAFESHQQRAQVSHWAVVTANLPRHYTITTDAAEP